MNDQERLARIDAATERLRNQALDVLDELLQKPACVAGDYTSKLKEVEDRQELCGRLERLKWSGLMDTIGGRLRGDAEQALTAGPVAGPPPAPEAPAPPEAVPDAPAT